MNKCFKLCVFAFFGVLVFTNLLFGQSMPDIQGFDPKSVYYYFDRADREIDQVKWIETARRGIDLSLVLWEEVASKLYYTADKIGNEKIKIKEWSENELLDRYSKWLLSRFFGDSFELTSAALSNTIKQNSINMIENKTDSFDNDLSEWNKLNKNIVFDRNTKFNVLIERYIPEILFFTDNKDNINPDIENLTGKLNDSFKEEFNAMILREERLFTARRLGDFNSIRKTAEENSPDVISDKLIKELNQSINNDILLLKEKLIVAEDGIGDFALNGSEWLEQYRIQFEKGLKAWETAEESFLVKRIEMEQSAKEDYNKSSEAWQKALDKFEQSRAEWEANAKTVFEEGKLLFTKLSEEYSDSFKEIEEEYKRNYETKIQSLVKRAEGWTDIYLTSANAAALTKSNIDFWTNRLNMAINDNDSFTIAKAKTEIETLKKLYDSYGKKYIESRDKLLSEYNLVLSTGVLDKIIKDGDFKDDLFFEDYQVEYLRATATAGYWEKEVSISKTIFDYASNNSSGRITRNEQIDNWQIAKNDYLAALNSYQASIGALKDLGYEIEKLTKEIENKNLSIEILELNINELEKKYNEIISIKDGLTIMDIEILLNQKRDDYNKILPEFDDSNIDSIRNKYFNYLQDFGILFEKENIYEVIKTLIDGPEEFPGSLGVLTAEYLNLKYFNDADELLMNIEDTGLNKENIYYKFINELKNNMDIQDQFSDFNKELIFRAFNQANEVISLNRNERINALKLLIAESNFEVLSIFEGYGIDDLYDMNDINNVNYLKEKAVLHRDAFNYLLNNVNVSIEAQYLSKYCNLTVNEIGEKIVILDNIIDILSNGNTDIVMEKLGKYAANDENAWNYLNGEEWFKTIERITIENIILSGVYMEKIKTAGLINLYSDFEYCSPFISKNKITENLNILLNYYIANEITDNNIFLDSKTIIDKFTEKAYMNSGGMEYFDILEEILLYLPDYVQYDYSEWKKNIFNMAVSKNKISGSDYEMADEYSLIMNKLFKSCQNINIVENNYKALIGQFIVNPSKEWKDIENDLGMDDKYENLLMAGREYNEAILYKSQLAKDIDYLESVYNLHNDNLMDLEAAAILKQLDNEKSKYYDLLNELELINDAYKTLDFMYSEAYNLVFENSKNVEKKLYNYEVEEGVKNWAENQFSTIEDVKNEFEYNIAAYERANEIVLLIKEIENKNGGKDENIVKIEKDYENSMNEVLLLSKVKTRIDSIIYDAERTVKSNYEEWVTELSGFSNYIEEMYKSNNEQYIDILNKIKIENGKLKFSYNDKFVFNEDNPGLDDYFNRDTISENYMYNISQFEVSLLNLVKAISFTELTYSQWGLARDYLMEQLINNNKDCDVIKNFLKHTEQLEKGSRLGKIRLYNGMRVYLLFNGIKKDEKSIRKNAWNSLTDKQKEDLEFLTVLSLMNFGDNKFKYFSAFTEYRELKLMYDFAGGNYIINRGSKYSRNMRDANSYSNVKYIRSNLAPIINELNKNINEELSELNINANEIININNNFIQSSEILNDIIYGNNDGNIKIDDILLILAKDNEVSDKEIKNFKEIWNTVIVNNNIMFETSAEAIGFLLEYSKEKKDKIKNLLASTYMKKITDLNKSKNNYLNMPDDYIAGDIDSNTVKEAITEAYMEKSLLTGYINALIKPIVNTINLDMGDSGYLEDIKNDILDEYINIITNANKIKNEKNLEIKNNEYNLKQKNLNDNYNNWVLNFELLLERGRLSWKTNNEKILNGFISWNNDFNKRYDDAADQWNFDYYSGLMAKENWLKAVENAALNASKEELLLLASGAEAGARQIDVLASRNAGYTMSYDKARDLINSLMGNCEIVSFDSMLESAKQSCGVKYISAPLYIKSDDITDLYYIQHRTRLFTKEANAEIEKMESVKLAINISDMIKESISNLKSDIEKANKRFEKNMDETFIMQGRWNKKNGSYSKRVIVHSTFFTSMIFETANVENFKFYSMSKTDFNVDVNEEILNGQNSVVIQMMIKNMKSEVENLYKEIFEEENGEEYISKGKFGLHLGYGPKQKRSTNLDKGRKGVFENYGEGEIGRLMTEYIFWDMKEIKGIAALNAARWDKPLWDSRNSSFNAPSVRKVADIGGKIATMVVGAVAAVPTGGASLIGAIALAVAINTADDILFNSLDAMSGYKTWGEAGLATGKVAVMNTVDASIGVLFGGASGVQSEILKTGLTAAVASKATSQTGSAIMTTFMKGAQTLTSGTVNSLVSSVNYSKSGGWEFSNDNFKNGMISTGKNMIASVGGNFTANILDNGLNGFVKDIMSNGKKFDNMIGGITGQGLNYAMGEDISLNILNAGIFSNNRYNAGLLEMRVGKNGVNFDIGMGGMDFSLKEVMASLKGIEAWKVNTEIMFSGKESAVNYREQMRTLYSMGGLNTLEYRDYITGKAVIESWDNDYTQSIKGYDGVKYVYLGTDAAKKDGNYNLNILLSHEAYRDGIKGTEKEQMEETKNAIIGHIETANEILNSYGLKSIGLDMLDEVIGYNISKTMGNNYAVDSLLNKYDYTDDYWKLISRSDGTHNIVWDGNKYLTIEYQDENGNLLSNLIPFGQDNAGSKGWAESLASVIGLERCEQLLGSGLKNASTYRADTLRDVLGLSDAEIMEIQQNGVLPDNISNKQRLSLAGEALLYKTGSVWENTKWLNIESLNLTLTDKKTGGYILGEKNDKDEFDYSYINSYIYRNINTYLGWSSYEGNKYDPSKQGLDRIYFAKYALDGKYISSESFDKLHTVDNMTTNKDGLMYDQPYNHSVYGKVQGNTIAPGTFNMKYYDMSDSYANDVLVINSAKTISGLNIDRWGNGGNDSLRWLGHSNRMKGMDSDFASYYSDGCFVIPADVMNNILGYLNAIGMQKGYQIGTVLKEGNF